jgi:hypothetical protein
VSAEADGTNCLPRAVSVSLLPALTPPATALRYRNEPAVPRLGQKTKRLLWQDGRSDATWTEASNKCDHGRPPEVTPTVSGSAPARVGCHRGGVLARRSPEHPARQLLDDLVPSAQTHSSHGGGPAEVARPSLRTTRRAAGGGPPHGLEGRPQTCVRLPTRSKVLGQSLPGRPGQVLARGGRLPGESPRRRSATSS